ncbi:MAG TPA: thioesterase II family protein [Blastocatellia bacterium]|nr:thioesterase II family protein [Blastocatellia bacterium]
MVTRQATPWVVIPKPNPSASVRLFCFPYAGGTAAGFRKWPAGLPNSVEVWSVQYPGRGSRIRESPFTRIAPLVDAAAEALMPYMDSPFAFFGHSMGAVVAFELSRILRRELSRTPLHLFVSGRRAPQVVDDTDEIYKLPDDEFVEELRRLNGTPAEVLEHKELMQLMLPLLRADFEAIGTYEYREEPPLACPISAFGGLEDQDVSRDNLAAWRSQTTSSFSVRMMPGDHFFLHSGEPLLLGALAQELAKF